MMLIFVIGVTVLLLLGSFFEHDYSGAPPLARTEDSLVYSIEIKVDTLKLLESATPWSTAEKPTFEAECAMRNFLDDDGKEFVKDGKTRIPFWACDSLQECLVNAGKAKGWVKLAYYREVSIENNRLGEPVETSKPNWAVFAED